MDHGNPTVRAPANNYHNCNNTDTQHQQDHPKPAIPPSTKFLNGVDYSLLVMYTSQFIQVGAFADTGVFQNLFYDRMGECTNQPTQGPCLYWFVLVVAVLTNMLGAVPVTQMIAATLPYSPPYVWAQTSLAISVGSNLTLIGSDAIMMTAFLANDESFTWFRYMLFAVLPTLMGLFVGAYLLDVFHGLPECSERLMNC